MTYQSVQQWLDEINHNRRQCEFRPIKDAKTHQGLSIPQWSRLLGVKCNTLRAIHSKYGNLLRSRAYCRYIGITPQRSTKYPTARIYDNRTVPQWSKLLKCSAEMLHRHLNQYGHLRYSRPYCRYKGIPWQSWHSHKTKQTKVA